MAKTFAPKSTFTPGETNARAVRPAEPTPTRGKPGARTSDTAPVPQAGDTAAAASDTATATEAAPAKTAKPKRTRALGKHRK